MAFKITGTFDVNTGNSLQATDEVSKGMQTAANSTVSLKKELREMQQQLATLDPNSKAFQELSVRAGEVKDKINDASEAVRANAGNAFEGLANNTGLLTDRLMNLDFEGVASAARGMGASLGRIDMKTLTAGVEQAGSALISLGTSLLKNPLFYLGAAIAGIIIYWDDLTKAVGMYNAEAERTKQLQADINAEYNTQIKAVAKDIVQIEGLFTAVMDQNKAESERMQALEDLQTLYPDLFANQDIDINNTNALTAAKLGAVEAIKAEAKANAARALLEKEYAKQFEQQLQLQEKENKLKEKQADLEKSKTFQRSQFESGQEAGMAQVGAASALSSAQSEVDALNKEIELTKKNIADITLAVGESVVTTAHVQAETIRNTNKTRVHEHKTTTNTVKEQEDKLQEQLDAMRKENELARMDTDAREIAEFELKYAKLRDEAQGNADKLAQIDQLEFDDLMLLLEKQSARQVEITLKTQQEEQKIKDEAKQKELDALQKQNDLRIQMMKPGIKKELAELTAKYEADLLLAGDNAELKKQVEEKYVADITAIDDKYRDQQRKKDEEDRQARLKGIQDNIDLASQGFSALSSLGDAYFANRKNKLNGDEKASKALAEKQFKFNKKMQLAGAIIDAGKAITASLAASPVAIGAVPNPAGIASLAFASTTSAANIAKILATKFDGGSTTSNTTPSPSVGGGGEGGAPQFNPLASAFINNRPGQTGPTPAYVLAGDVTSAQEARNKVQDLARL